MHKHKLIKFDSIMLEIAYCTANESILLVCFLCLVQIMHFCQTQLGHSSTLCNKKMNIIFTVFSIMKKYIINITVFFWERRNLSINRTLVSTNENHIVIDQLQLRRCHTRQFFLATCNAKTFQAAFYKRNRLL